LEDEDGRSMNNEKDELKPGQEIDLCDLNDRGHLKIFIGYAPGVGKTFSMLNEGNRRSKRGEDIVVGYLEAHNRPETIEQLAGLEVIPRKKVEYSKIFMEEMDTEAIIARNPQTVLIDEIAHLNVPGSKNKKRYIDIEEILCKGINVITTLNIEHLESLNDVVRKITGIAVKETIPDYVVEKANEVVVIDITPEALLNRLKRGNIFEMERVPQELDNFFRKGNLNALRELVLRETAEEVEEDLEEYMKAEGIKENWHTVEKVLVCISASATARKMIRRGARISARYKCEWTVVTVNCTNVFAKKPSLKHRQMIYNHFKLAKQLGAEVETLTGKSVSEELAKYAKEKHVTQIIIGHARRSMFETLMRGSTVNKLLEMAKDVEIHIIPNDKFVKGKLVHSHHENAVKNKA
jgi:two-component system, OmpR family, sensor histidine kinase KdpD